MTELIVKTRRGVALFKNNPFITSVPVKTRRVTNKRGNMQLVSTDTGEIHSNIAGFWESEEVDSTKFVKLFVNGVKALKELTGAGTKVFEVLYLKVQENIGIDRIYLSYSNIDQALTPMSEATYTRGMRELIEKEFIAATLDQGLFWLNPDFVWNGDRIAFVKEIRKKQSNKALSRDPKTIDLLTGMSDEEAQNDQI